MKVFKILIVTVILSVLAAGGGIHSAGAGTDEEGIGGAGVNTGLRIRLDINPATFSGSILFERGPWDGDPHRTFSLNVIRGEEPKALSISRSLQDRFKAMRIITQTAARLLEKALFTLL